MTIKDIKYLVSDFDGVLTDNTVFVDQTGKETVRCNRGDGMAFSILKSSGLIPMILTTEENDVVLKRGEKLKIPVIHNVKNKEKALRALAEEGRIDLQKTLYIGNDVNDHGAMKACRYSACPSDGSREVKQIATYVLKAAGGQGVIRELVADVFAIDLLQFTNFKEKETTP